MTTVKLRKPTEEEKRKIKDAAEIGQLQILQELTSGGVDVTGIIKDNNNCTALHLAAGEGYYNIVTFLCQQGAVVDNIDRWKRTPLHYAAQRGHTDCVALLIKRGANVNTKNIDGNTPLQLTVKYSRYKTIEYFIKQVKMDITQFDMKTQQKINELVKKAEDKQMKGDNQPGSHDIQQDLHDLTLQTQVTYHMNTADINTKDKIMKQQMKQADRLVDYSVVQDYIRSHYDKLAHLTISNSFVISLYQNEVITLDEKMAIKELKERERMEHLLDHVITPSLKCQHATKYINFINVMQSCDDSLLKKIAFELTDLFV